MNASISTRMIRSVHLSELPTCALGLMVLLSGCVSTAKYSPAVKDNIPVPSDQVSSVTIPVSVQMAKLVDRSPAEDKEDGWLYGTGWSVTSPERLKGPLDVVLKDAIMNDFKEHGIFKEFDQQDHEDQLKLEGKVHKFYQRREHYLWSLCCGLLGILIPPSAPTSRIRLQHWRSALWPCLRGQAWRVEITPDIDRETTELIDWREFH